MATDWIDAIAAKWDRASPGPWFVVHLDDDAAINLVGVATVWEKRHLHPWDADFPSHKMVCATLVQAPRYVDHDDGRWDENAAAIADAPTDIRLLIAEVRRLRGPPP